MLSSILSFQALIGMLQTKFINSNILLFFSFQALIGMLQTPKNPETWHKSEMFQALIGMLQTFVVLPNISERVVFQALIGMLQTSLLIVFYYLVVKFQALIGMLQTGVPGLRVLFENGFQALIGMLQTPCFFRVFCVWGVLGVCFGVFCRRPLVLLFSRGIDEGLLFIVCCFFLKKVYDVGVFGYFLFCLNVLTCFVFFRTFYDN